MKFHHTRFLSLFLVAALLLTPVASLAQTAQPQPTEPLSAIQIISENTQLDLTPYQGKAIFLNFFTKWCPYCMRELPDIKKIYEDYSPDELQIILVHVWDGETAAESEEIRKTYGLEDMTFFEDEDRLLSYVAGLQGYPLSLFLSQDESVAQYCNYAMNYDQMAAVLDEMGVARKADAQ